MSKQRDIKISQQLCWHELKSVKNSFSFNAIYIVRFLHSIYTIEDRLGMYIYVLSFFFQFNFRLMFTTMSKQRPLNLQKIIQYWRQRVFLPMSSIQMHRGFCFLFFFSQRFNMWGLWNHVCSLSRKNFEITKTSVETAGGKWSPKTCARS